MQPADLITLIRRTKVVGDPNETHALVVINAIFEDAQTWLAWRALQATPPAWLSDVTLTREGGDRQVDDDTVPPPTQVYRIALKKHREANVLSLLFGRSLKTVVAKLVTVNSVQIADLPADGTFLTQRTRFLNWTTDPVPDLAVIENLPNPQKHCRDLSGKGLVPPDIRPWLVRTKPTKDDTDTYTTWRALAAERLLAAVADQVTFDSPAFNFLFAGPPAITVAPTPQDLEGYFDDLTAGAEWVFCSGTRDTDTRHLLLGAEWARTYRNGAPSELGVGSLASAEHAYNAYVKSGSKETLKALSDLRKTVVEESQKASQRAHDLTSAMWKDLAVASAPFVLKILPDASKSDSAAVAGGLAIAAALFLAFSFTVQVWINKSYFQAQKVARHLWQSRLNLALTKTEINEISEVPVQTSLKTYRRVRCSVGIFYLILIVILLIFARSQLCPASPEVDGTGDTSTHAVMESNTEDAESSHQIELFPNAKTDIAAVAPQAISPDSKKTAAPTEKKRPDTHSESSQSDGQ